MPRGGAGGTRADAASLPQQAPVLGLLRLRTGTCSSADYQQINGRWQRSRKKVLIRGLNIGHNHDLKNIFKGAAMSASIFAGPLKDFYQQRLVAGIKPEMAQLTLARKIAAIGLILWKKGESFDADRLNLQAA